MASCCCPPQYDPRLVKKINQIQSYVSASRQYSEAAEGSAEAAEGSAEAAEGSAEDAATSAAQAAASAELAGIYLGSFAVAPTTDNEGGPLQEGMLYYNTVSNGLFVWNGTAWTSTDFNEFTNFLATGTTTARNLVTRTANAVFVEDFGAIGNGVNDDSAAFQAALNAKSTVHLDGAKQYVVKNINLTNSRTIIGNGARFKAAAGATYLFKLQDFSPHIQDIYVSECTASDAAIVFGGSRFASINNVRILNCSSSGILFKTNVLTIDTLASVAKPQLSNVHVEGFQSCGLDIRSNVNEINAVNVYLDSGLNATLDAPRPGTYGVKVVSTGSTAAYGGHLYVNITTINSQYGWHFTDAELTKMDSCIADGHSSDGISLNGQCQYFDIYDTFIGTCGRSINVSGTSSNNSFSGIRSIFTGVVPPWGAAPFFTYSAPFYDIAVNDTASVSLDIDAWFGQINSLAATNNSINWVGGDKFDLISTSTIAANSTVYLGPAGQFTNINNALWTPSTACRIIGFYVSTDLAPGVGGSFTYTINVNGTDTAMTATSSGAASFTAQTFTSPSIFVNKNVPLTIKLVTSLGASSANHRGYIITAPQV